MKTLLVTGGSRGIGAATARLAARRGYHVVLTYQHNRAAADAVVAEIAADGGSALALAADVSVEHDIIRVFEYIATQIGALDGLVNNAATLEQQMRFDQIDLARLQRVFSTNVFGAFLCAREAVKLMSTRYGGAGGSIVNVSSTSARLGSPNEYVDYAATKGAIDTMTVGLAKEVAAEKIRVNSVRPGVIATELHARGGEPQRVERVAASVPMQRGGHAEEVAHAILWLLSDEASYVTGACLDVAGGR